MQCSVCGHTEFFGLFEIEECPVLHYPVDTLQLDEFKNLGLPSKAQLSYAMCDYCGACLLEKKGKDVENAIAIIYSRFYNYPSPLKDGIATEEADKVFELLKNLLGKGKQILEIGCYDGYLLYLLEKEGHSVTGCDPSRGADIGKEFGINIVKDYFKPELFPNKSFDLVIFRNLIEHVPYPLEFLKNLSKVVKPGGSILIQTPNLEKSLKEGSLIPFHFEHEVLFDGRLLEHCLSASGFSSEEIAKDESDLLVMGTKTGKEHKLDIDTERLGKLKNLAKKFRKNMDDDQMKITLFLEKMSKEGKKIALWGAGAGSAYFIAMHPEAKFEYIVDNDSRKWGNTYLFAEARIVPPETLESEPPDVILINSTFFSEIHEQLMENDVKIEIYDTLPNFKKFTPCPIK